MTYPSRNPSRLNFFQVFASMAIVAACGPSDETSREITPAEVVELTNTLGTKTLVEPADSASAVNDTVLPTLSKTLTSDCEADETEDSGDDFSFTTETQDALDWLLEQIVTEENAEQLDAETVIFPVGPEIVCEEDDMGMRDPDCVETITNNPVRLLVTSEAENSLSMKLELGTDHEQAMSIELDSTSMEVRIDLGAMKLFHDDLELGEGEQILAVDDKLTGVWSWRIEVLDGDAVVATFSFEEDFELEVRSGNASPATELRAAKSTPSLKLEADPETRIVRFTGDLRMLEFIFPEDDFCEDEATCAAVKAIAAKLPGLSGVLEFDGETEEIRFTDVSMGESNATLTYGDTTVIRSDLNPEDGRSFTGSIRRAESGDYVMQVQPKIHLALALKLLDTAESEEDLPDWLEDQLFDVMLSGEPLAEVVLPADEACVSSDLNAIKVQTGTLTWKETHNGSMTDNTLTVAEGMCMGESSEDGSGLFLNEGLEEIACE